jgi:hypothetical protein
MQKYQFLIFLFNPPWTKNTNVCVCVCVCVCIMHIAKVLKIHSKLVLGVIETENKAFLCLKC